MKIFRLMEAPGGWGDYSSVLWGGLVRKGSDGGLSLERVGPFVPPIGEAYPVWYVVEQLRDVLIEAGVETSLFTVLPVSKCVRLDWHLWRGGEGFPLAVGATPIPPPIVPEGGEPEGFVLNGRSGPGTWVTHVSGHMGNSRA
jgi:hypothetical protein